MVCGEGALTDLPHKPKRVAFRPSPRPPPSRRSPARREAEKPPPRRGSASPTSSSLGQTARNKKVPVEDDAVTPVPGERPPVSTYPPARSRLQGRAARVLVPGGTSSLSSGTGSTTGGAGFFLGISSLIRLADGSSTSTSVRPCHAPVGRKRSRKNGDLHSVGSDTATRAVMSYRPSGMLRGCTPSATPRTARSAASMQPSAGSSESRSLAGTRLAAPSFSSVSLASPCAATPARTRPRGRDSRPRPTSSPKASTMRALSNCTSCPRGGFCPDPGAASASVRVPCNAGTYCPDEGASNASSCRHCPPGTANPILAGALCLAASCLQKPFAQSAPRAHAVLCVRQVMMMSNDPTEQGECVALPGGCVLRL